MKATLAIAFIILFSIEGHSQTLKKVDSLQAIVTKINNEKSKRLTLKLCKDFEDSALAIGESQLIGTYKNGELIKFIFKNDGWGMGDDIRTFYLSDSSLIYVEENYYTVVSMGGPTKYELTYNGRFYFLNDALLIKMITGESRFYEKTDVGETVLKDFTYFRELLENKIKCPDNK